ncbi:MAG: hypothetical protein HUJ31_08305, partial [Pseudomonadales bacterium]|nr:hypothetical protein [Pseudomonadales bacterium]
MQNAALIDIDAQLNAATDISLINATDVNIAVSASPTLTTTNGSIDISTGVGGITVDGAGTVTLDQNGNTGNVALAALSTTATSVTNVTVAAEGDVTLGGALDLEAGVTDGSLSVTVDDNAANSTTETLLVSGAVTNVNDITLSGSGTGDTIDIDANITTTGGDLTLQNAGIVDVDATTLTSAGAIRVINVTDLQLAAGLTLSALGGDIDLYNAGGVTGITLDGSGSVILDADLDSDVLLAAVDTTGATSNQTTSLTVNAEGSVSANGAIDLDGGASADGALSMTADNDNDTIETLAINGAITNVAGATLQGGATANEVVDINADISSTSGITVQNAGEIQLLAGITLDSQGGTLDLNNNVTSTTLN